MPKNKDQLAPQCSKNVHSKPVKMTYVTSTKIAGIWFYTWRCPVCKSVSSTPVPKASDSQDSQDETT